MHRIGETIPLTYPIWDSTNNILLTGQAVDLKLDIVDENDTTVVSYFLGDAEISEYPGPSGVYYVNVNGSYFDGAGVYKGIWNCQIEGAEGYYVELIKIHSRDIDNVDDRLASDTTGLQMTRMAARDLQTELDNPAQFKADVSTLSTQTSVDDIAGQLVHDSTGFNIIRMGAAVIEGVWDEVLTGATHNVPTSAGRRLRQAENVLIIHDGTAQGDGGGTDTIQLQNTASVVNDWYFNCWIIIVSGTGAGQLRHVMEYVGGASFIATMDSDWITPPAADSEYIVIARSTTMLHEISADGLNQILPPVTQRLDSDATGLNVIRLEASDNPDVAVDLTPVTQRLDNDSTGLHVIKTFLQDLHFITFNKVVLTRISSTSYKVEVYDAAGLTIVRTINLTKDDSVETRE